jgi:hypothetical protein
MNPTERAHRAAAGLLAYSGINQRRAAEHIGMNEKRISERISQGTMFLRDFLAIAHAEQAGDFLRMLADQIDGGATQDRPIDAAMMATEAAGAAQRTVREARADGQFCHWEILQMRQAADEAHAKVTQFKTALDSLKPGPVRSSQFAAE